MAPRGYFSGNPVVEFLPDGRRVRVWGVRVWGATKSAVVGNALKVIPLVFVRPTGDKTTIDPGFTCDGLSQPFWLWGLRLSPYTGRSRNAALVHDQLYATQRTDSGPITRREADRCFYEAMAVCGTTWFVRRAKYLAVRLFSAGGWRSLI